MPWTLFVLILQNDDPLHDTPGEGGQGIELLDGKIPADPPQF